MNAELFHVVVGIAGFCVSIFTGVLAYLLRRSIAALDDSQNRTETSVERAHERISENGERLAACESKLGIYQRGAHS